MLKILTKENLCDNMIKRFGGLAQLARAPALQAGGHRFDSDILHQKTDVRKGIFFLALKREFQRNDSKSCFGDNKVLHEVKVLLFSTLFIFENCF